MAVYDHKRMLVDSDVDVQAGATGAAVDFSGEDSTEMFYRILVPKKPTTLTVEIEHSDNKSDWHLLVKSEPITKAGEFVLHARSKKKYRRAKYELTGNAGALKIGAVPAGTSANW